MSSETSQSSPPEGERAPEEDVGRSQEQSLWTRQAYEFYRNQFSANDIGLQAIQRKLADIDQALNGGALPQWIDRAWDHNLRDLREGLSRVLEETRVRMIERQQGRGQLIPPEPETPSGRVEEVQQAIGDWRDALTADQRERLQEYEERIADTDLVELQEDLVSIQDAQKLYRRTNRWPADYWVPQQDATAFRKAIAERIARLTSRPETQVESENPLQSLSPEVRLHLNQLQARLQRERGGEVPSLDEVVGMVGEEFHKATLIGTNLPVWLAPPALKRELQQLFGLPAQIPIKAEQNQMTSMRRGRRRNGG